MVERTLRKAEILALMRRVGKHDRIEEAERILPDPVHLDRDNHLLTELGMSADAAIQAMGGSPY